MTVIINVLEIERRDWLEAKEAKEKEMEIDFNKAPKEASHYTSGNNGGYDFC